MSDFKRPEHWKEEYSFDVDKVELDKPEVHKWVQVGEQLICTTEGHHHASFLPIRK